MTENTHHDLFSGKKRLEVARIAGIQAAKRTGELIPLCHPLLLDQVALDLALADFVAERIQLYAPEIIEVVPV